jgi:hypothetical protein
MTKVHANDLVLHFYEDTVFGRDLDHYFCGVSLADDEAEIRADAPPQPGEWVGRPGYYRIGLKSFKFFTDPVSIRDFARKHNAPLIDTLPDAEDPPFIVYNSQVRLAQGKYLARCGRKLYELLSGEIEAAIDLSGAENSSDRRTREPVDYEQYVEGQRSRREAAFFARNPRLVRDAKEHYGTRCMACRFDYEDRYQEFGKRLY